MDKGKLVIVLFFLVLFSFVLSRGVWVDKSVAVRALEIQGYQNIEVLDHAWFVVGMRGCDEKDAARFTVRATNALGKNVELYVCSGWIFKGATIRTK